MQFKAGYIVDTIAKVISDFKATLDKHKPADQTQLDQINGLLQHASSFDVEFAHEHHPDFKNLNPVLATLSNIITRGLPTKAPIFLEKKFYEIGLTEKTDSDSEISYEKSTKCQNYKEIFELLHIIEPQLEISKTNYGGQLDSHLEWEFIGKHPFLKQIIQSQRSFSTIVGGVPLSKRVDFSFTSPYIHIDSKTGRQKNISRIFEVDGPHHLASEHIYYDTFRDHLTETENFETIRFNHTIIQDQKIDFNNLLERNQYKIFEKNYQNDVSKHLAVYSLIFIPLAVARIQKTILEFLLFHPKLFKKEKIEIAIIERDLPCGAIAIKSLQELFDNINAILEDKDKLLLPEISLTVFENKKWVIDSKLHIQASVKDESFFEQDKFDIILDHSILRRSDIYKETDFQNDNSIKIRSSHYFDTSFGSSRRVYCSDQLHYKSLVKKKDDGSYIPINKYETHINFFIQNIFRKVGFRDGQLPIISRALQQKPVIGLLPTGGGKSLAYQLPTFLQPGLCLVVDPIKSLMEDQVRVLEQNWIDCCGFINSNLKREEKVKRLIDFRYGETMFLFISPERFVMQDFRNIIRTIDVSKFGLAFSYCVIDEVHCVSEWGHDFRSTYLMLGKNAQRFAKTKSGIAVSLIGLTATASFDVLTDIERELSIDSSEVNDAVISIDNTIRPELFFSVVENKVKPTTFPIKTQQLKDTIGFAKQDQINKHIEEIIGKLNSINEEVVTECLKQHFRDFELNINFEDENHKTNIDKIKNGILKQIKLNDINDVISVIFCPHTTGTYGITQDANPFPKNKELFENLIVPIEKKGYFMGGDDKIRKEVLENAQKYFLQFLQGKINYMVCTKAFGMGIDKEHIRSICHLNFSSSPESYIQEAGRAGRDKVKSLCTIFLDRNFYYTIKKDFIADNNPQKFKLIVDRKKTREVFEDYNSSQNRISQKYYEDQQSLSQSFANLGIELDNKYIDSFNQDLSIHEYFHSNSFKGIETEIYQLDRFINYNEGINTTQLKLLQEKYNLEYDDDVSFYLTPEGAHIGNLWLRSNQIPFGKIKTNKHIPDFIIGDLGGEGKPDENRTKNIFNFLMNEWENGGKIGPLFFNFLQKEIVEGLNDGLTLVEYFENTEKDNFVFKVPNRFNTNNLEGKLVQDFNLNKLAIIDAKKTTEDFLNTLIRHSANFDDFILRIEEQWDLNIMTNPIYVQNRTEYKKLYYSEINNADVLRIIYRLYSMGFIDDYTIDYNLGILTIEVVKREKEYYIDKTQSHLLRYLSRTATLKIINELIDITQELSVFGTIKKCVKEILMCTYKDIVKKRKDAVNDLFKFITESLDQSKLKENNLAFNEFWYNHHFKDEMYYYFNAKYAREGFQISNEPYSLLDDTERGQISDWETFEKYALVLNSQTSFISECKMMRGSCRRIWRTLHAEDHKREYALKLLSSFATFGLNNKFYYQEAEDLFIDGFTIFYEQHQNYELLKEKILNFEWHLHNSTSNKNYLSYLNLAKHKIMLKTNTKFAKKITEHLNIHYNEYRIQI